MGVVDPPPEPDVPPDPVDGVLGDGGVVEAGGVGGVGAGAGGATTVGGMMTTGGGGGGATGTLTLMPKEADPGLALPLSATLKVNVSRPVAVPPCA